MKQPHENPSPLTYHKEIYSCPMHQEVHLEHPGSCPKCGMRLEKVVDTAPEIRIEYVCPMHPDIIRNKPGVCPSAV